jgi:hypothetical protein
MEIVDQRKDLFGRRPYHGGTLDGESVRLGRGKNKYDRDGDRDNTGDDGGNLEHGTFPS